MKIESYMKHFTNNLKAKASKFNKVEFIGGTILKMQKQLSN